MGLLHQSALRKAKRPKNILDFREAWKRQKHSHQVSRHETYAWRSFDSFIRRRERCPVAALLLDFGKPDAVEVLKDAFFQCPQLKLEDLTYSDMHTFVASRLESSPRWLLMGAADHNRASRFIERMVAKAGVFLMDCSCNS